MPTKARWEAMGPEEREKYRLWTLNWQRNNRERMRELNRQAYVRNGRTRADMELYHKRVSRCRFTDELTKLVSSEAANLRNMRNELTNIKWHVDHIVPIKGTDVCGLHIWSNLRVIPASENLAKKNKLLEGGL